MKIVAVVRILGIYSRHLMYFARIWDVAVTKALIVAGADVNKREDQVGQTGLMWAAAVGHADVVSLLLAANADP